MLKQRLTIFLFTLGLLLPLSVAFAGTIVSPHQYAWSNNVGYINFENVIVGDNALSGSAWSANKGFIIFNPTQGGVLNDGTGNLSGSAWGEQLGWIDFNAVSIDGIGKFSGTATGTLVGTITFDCPTYCNVLTDWRPVSIQTSANIGDGDQGPNPAEAAVVTTQARTVVSSPLQNQNTLVALANSSDTQAVDTSIASPSSVVGEAEQPALFDITAELSQSPGQFSPKITIIGGSLILGAGLAILFLALRGKWHARNLRTASLIIVMALSLFAGNDVLAQEQESSQNTQVHTTSAGLATKVAPGELLPVSVKLLNFGGGKKVDVLVTYEIFNEANTSIYSIQETVAVETTASFVKTLQIPFDTPFGKYTAKTSILYKGQVTPATTQFPFQVERKILGLFQDDFFLYGGVTTVIGICMVLFGHALIKRRRTERLVALDYSDIPHDTRVFYELLSDTIMEMRERVGDDALNIASHIDGLKIDTKTGRVIDLTEHPSKIIATLVAEYEKLFGKKVSFSFRRDQKNI